MRMIKRPSWLMLTLLILAFSIQTQAATIEPNIFTDPTVNPVGEPENCSLRYAIQALNDGAPFAGCVNTGADDFGTNDTIILQVGTYALTQSGVGEDSNETGDLDFNGNEIIILGAGSDQTTIDGSGMTERDRVLDLNALNAQISGLRITGGDISAEGEFGGGISSSTVNIVLDDVHLIGNLSNGGGGLFALCSVNISNSIIEGNQALMFSMGNDGGGGILINPSDGCAGMETSFIENTWVINNSTDGQGGGIRLGNGRALLMTRSTIDGNTATNEGGGLHNESGTVVGITYSTISRNRSLTAGVAPGGQGAGGTVGGGGISDRSALLALANSTLSMNESVGDGGGIQSQGGLKGLYNVTVAYNRVTRSGGTGGGVQRNVNSDPQPPFDIQVYNTIMAQNEADDSPDCEGGFVSGGFNLIGNVGDQSLPGDCQGFVDQVNGDQVGSPAAPIDPQLEPLGFYGGMTETHALLALSPAVDRGNNLVGCESLDFELFFQSDFATAELITLSDDQRMFPRPIAVLDPNNPICDIGAFELQNFTFEISKDDGLPDGTSVESGDSFTYTILITNNGPGVASGVVLNDPLPPELTYQSHTTSQGTCAPAGNLLTCDLGDLNPGAAVTVTLTVLVGTSSSDSIVNTVTVTTSVGDFTATETTPFISGGNNVQGSGCALNPKAPDTLPGNAVGFLAACLLAAVLSYGFCRRISR